MRGKKGFSLIELLVVIAIIAILAAILFPIITEAKNSGKTASCQSNVKQLAVAVLAYTSDYNDTFPLGYNSTTNTCLPQTILHYIKNWKIWDCPAGGNKLSAILADTSVVDVGYNMALGSSVPGKADMVINMGGVVRPTRTIMMADTMDTRWTAAWAVVYANGDPRLNPRGWPVSNVANRHREGANVAFVDGHAKWYSRNELLRSEELWDWWQ